MDNFRNFYLRNMTCVRTSHLNDNQQMSIAMQHIADFMSMVTHMLTIF
jgi:hypothetical protein